MICVLFGGPGSGKGTQAELIAPVLGVPHISTGDLLRAEAAAGSPLGKEVAPLLAAGELVPDELIERVVEQRLKSPDTEAGALLDGYPRTVPQARVLDQQLESMGRRVRCVLHLEADEATLVGRLLRRAEAQHRSDDNPASITERLAEYGELTAPVIDYYREAGVPVFEIDGTGGVEEVHGRIVEALEDPGVPSRRVESAE
jgi:adenylate kinase